MTIPGSLRCILILLTFSFVVVDAQLLFLNILKKRRKKKERRNLINYCWIAQGALQSVASLRIFHSEQSEWQLQQSRLLLYSRLFKYVHTCVFSRVWNIEVGFGNFSSVHCSLFFQKKSNFWQNNNMTEADNPPNVHTLL